MVVPPGSVGMSFLRWRIGKGFVDYDVCLSGFIAIIQSAKFLIKSKLICAEEG